MIILITGSSGFVGQNLSPFLKTNDITVLPFSLRRDWHENMPMHYDAIIHLAGKVHDTRNIKTANYIQINTELTKQLFDRFLQSGAKDFIFLSSVKAVADTVAGALKEDVIPNPITPYGQSKLKAEEYLLSKELPKEKRLFILRPCMIHGPGNKGNLNLLYKVVKKGIPYPLGAFENKRSFLSIANLLFIIEQLLKDTSVPGGIYNVSDDGPLSSNEVIEIIGEASRTSAHIWNTPPVVINTIARLGDILRLPLTTERLKKLTESYIVSNEKIKKVLDIETLPVSSREGLAATIKSFD